MTTGAAYDVVQGIGLKGTLNAAPKEAKFFYAMIAAVTIAAVALNFIEFNPNDHRVLGSRVNSRTTNVLGWLTTGITFLAAIGLVVTWLA
jgi:hypothetical protein